MDQRNVLVVDNDTLVCWALRRELASLGVTVDSTGTGADALGRLGVKSYALLFLDPCLPDRDGLQLLPEIRRLRPQTRIVILSGEADVESKRRAFSGGASQFIEKPFELSEVVSFVRSALQEFPERRQHDRYCCHAPLRLAVLAPAPEEASLDLRNLSATAEDMSSIGLRCITRYPLRQGQRIEVWSLCEDPCIWRVREAVAAQVMWVRAGSSKFTAGLRFDTGVGPDFSLGACCRDNSGRRS